VLEAYLPPPVDPAEIERAVDDSIRELNATSAKDFGRVMKAVMSRLAGRCADGRLITDIVRRKLGS
ncbi:MAG: GatB/YqeY domain-containing protein, partial [Acidobacteria bacterium]|nr:GatB/YqeY domain-containing protein [Acidobacteriota bacterium]